MKKILTLTLFLAFVAVGAFAQNEAYRDFVPGTSLVRQDRAGWQIFPLIEIGFSGQHVAGEHRAFLFFRFQTQVEIGGGVFSRFLERDHDTGQLTPMSGDVIEQFMRLLGRASFNARLANMRGTALDDALGEIELADFQWFRVQNEWRRPPNGTARISVRLRTADGEHRLFFYRTTALRDQRNQSETFTMLDNVFLTESQVNGLLEAHRGDDTFFWRAMDAALNASRMAAR